MCAMIKSETNKFKKDLYILYPGDYFATKDDCMMGTVVGASVAVCIFDKPRKIGGMVLFVVPGTIGTEGIVTDSIARRGILSMEYLMGELVKLGGDRHFIHAKIFGAGYSNTGIANSSVIAESNIRFIHEYFTLEKINVERSDLGGDFRRKIYFEPREGTVYRQILKNNEDSSEFMKMEKEYIDSEFRNKKQAGRVVLFE
jgi:chemotaxis protein CheD